MSLTLALRVSNELPSVESLAEAIDVDALEQSSTFMANKYKAKKEEKVGTVAEGYVGVKQRRAIYQ